MTDSEYHKLAGFATTYLKDFQIEQIFYGILNELPRVNIVNCSDCLFHNDCLIETTLPETVQQKFCSYGKPKSTIINKGE